MSLTKILESQARSFAASPTKQTDENLFAVSTIANKPIEQPSEPIAFSENACQKCGSIEEWLPRFQNDIWQCVGCNPPLHRALIAQTRERACFGDDRVVFDPVTICVEKQVCKCGGRWLDLTMNGYRCGCCNASISMSADQIFWSSDDFSSLNGGELTAIGNERVFSK